MVEEYEYETAEDDEVFATIRFEELRDLIEDSIMLQCLNELGVAKWENYNRALIDYKEKSNESGFFYKSDPQSDHG